MKHFVVGVLVISLIITRLIFSTFLLAILAIFKLTFKNNFKFWNKPIVFISEQWIRNNNLFFKIFTPTKFTMNGDFSFDKKGNYILIANHQSWVDILAMQYMGAKKQLPFMRFFIKKELLFVPFAGFVWWVLDYPLLNRYSKEYLEKFPKKKGEDIKSMIKACEKFADIPSTVTIYPEGTRFDEEKYKLQKSPYQNLLKPKSGGLATAVTVLEERFSTLIDVSIYYPDGIPGFWDFVSGKVKEIKILVTQREIPRTFYGKNYFEDDAYKQEFSQWLNNIWQEKDAEIEKMKQG